MAVTKIHAIKSTVNKALRYILDPDKTDGTLLASGFNCEPTTAHLDFQMTALLAKETKGDLTNIGGANNLAYHLIQSFTKTDPVTPELAREIGKKLADEVFHGKHEYVIATHIDKGHIHNHIIANAVSFDDLTKFRTRPYETARMIREASDKLCRENGLHVIESPKGRGQGRQKWQTQPSWRDRLQLVIDNAIYAAASYQEFIDTLSTESVEIKEGKHIAFRMPGQISFIRGKSIGPEYSRDRIEARIAAPNKRKVIEFLPRTKLEKQVTRVFRRQTQAQTIAQIHELGDALLLTRREKVDTFLQYDKRIEELKKHCKEIRNSLKDLDQRNNQYRQVTKYLVAYQKYLPLDQELERTPTRRQKGFMKKYESELRVFAHAQTELQRNGIATTGMNQIVEIMKRQSQDTDQLKAKFRDTEARIQNLGRAKELMSKLLGVDEEQQKGPVRVATKERVR